MVSFVQVEIELCGDVPLSGRMPTAWAAKAAKLEPPIANRGEKACHIVYPDEVNQSALRVQLRPC
jgi:hypothetical protein